MKLFFRETALGKIGIGEKDGKITNLFLETDPAPEMETCETELVREAFRQLFSYLDGELREFSLPLSPLGTPFMREVWQALLTVPYGSTASYGQIARAVGNPKAVRAVGLANSRNPIPIFIPCHRIIGAGGKLVGFRGGLPLKRKLLQLEGVDGIFPVRT
jgi:methylated-DNA-[protein]-cysteine S-methyltransferase